MDVAEFFRALGDPVRLKIVCMLAESGELCVCKIVEELHTMGQPAVSHHLARLRYAGLIKPRKQGQWVHYSLNLDVLENSALAFVRQLVETAKTARPQSESCPPCAPTQ
jgi:ArsR family transcriptional regulator